MRARGPPQGRRGAARGGPPRAEAGSRRTAAASPVGSRMTSRPCTILVVDDDADARLIMRAALRKAGFEVRLAASGVDALRRFRTEPCEMVMLDVDMPDMSGYEV